MNGLPAAKQVHTEDSSRCTELANPPPGIQGVAGGSVSYIMSSKLNTCHARTGTTKSGRVYTSGLAPSGHGVVHFRTGLTWLRLPEDIRCGERPTMVSGTHVAPTFAVSS